VATRCLSSSFLRSEPGAICKPQRWGLLSLMLAGGWGNYLGSLEGEAREVTSQKTKSISER
jgi:hypothetical protein